ncbi:MAG: YlbE family protein [Dehalococcoidia bacterium]
MPDDLKSRIEAANTEGLKRINEAQPVLVDVAPAREVIPGMGERMILHSGPPVGWQRMCGAQRGAVIGMVLFEGWAKSPDAAIRMLEAGEVALDANHEHQAVGPMAGTISPSLPVYVVENQAHGNRAFCRQVEARQQFGEYVPEALQLLYIWRDTWGPSIGRALRHGGGVNLKELFANALQMGDELHNRPNGASALFGLDIGRRMLRAGVSSDDAAATLDMFHYNPVSALGLAMAAGKATADALRGLECSTVVRAMARNGTDFGIKVAGLGDEWFTAPSPMIEGLYLPGFSEQDAGRDMGDSAIAETIGLGGFVIAGAPGILSLVGGTPQQARQWTRDMGEITVGKSSVYRMPALGSEGSPTGIDIRKVVQTGMTPVIDTAIAHKDPGGGRIGAGIVRPPIECFKQALLAFGKQYSSR